MRHDEDILQAQVFEYLELRGIYAFHPKNSGKKSIQSAVRDKKLGVKAGVPDVVIIQGGRHYYIELKTPNGALSDSQKKFKEMCEYQLIPWAICRSLDDVIRTLKYWSDDESMRADP